MVRVQIRLEQRQHAELRRWARGLGMSVSEAVRRCVSETLVAKRAAATPAQRLRNALAVLGKYAEPATPSSVGREHDRHFARASRR